MKRLVMFGRAIAGTLTSAALVLIASTALAVPAEALAVAQPEAQLTLTCQFNNGPRAGQVQSFADMPEVQPMQIGVPCTDGQGSIGVAIPDAPVAPPVPSQPLPRPAAPATSFTCQFNNGPRAGQVQSYAGVTGIRGMPIGAPCTDGQGSTGIAISDTPIPPAQPVAPPAPAMSFTCQFNKGPRAGQIQSYAGVTGMQPMPMGSACTDGQGSIGVAIPDVPIPPPAPVAPLAPVPPPAAVPLPPPPVQPLPTPPAAPTSFTCRFDHGPRAGQVERFAGGSGVEPMPPGSPCADGEGSTGVALGTVIPRTHPIGNAAVGARIAGLPGAVWADPHNTGYVTGYALNGRYHPGTPRAYDPAVRAVVTGAVAAPSLAPASGPDTEVAPADAVSPPPPPVPPPFSRSGERG